MGKVLLDGLPPFQLVRDKRSQLSKYPETLLALDPGDMTGWAIFKNGDFHSAGQHSGHIPGVPDLIAQVKPDWVVYEDFFLYAHKADDQKWNKMNTPRLIGAIEYVCCRLKIPYSEQSASEAKGFATDDKLKAWNMWDTGGRHARDAIRHGVNWLVFGNENRAKRKFT